MTHIPVHFLALFADLHVGDELILHKGAGVTNWKIEILEHRPRGKVVPIPPEVWQSVIVPLSDVWYGTIRFYCEEQTVQRLSPWLVAIKTCVPVDFNQGMTTVR